MYVQEKARGKNNKDNDDDTKVDCLYVHIGGRHYMMPGIKREEKSFRK